MTNQRSKDARTISLSLSLSNIENIPALICMRIGGPYVS